MRHQVTFSSGDGRCAAWWYATTRGTDAPVVVLGIGLGSIKEMGLDPYARAFASAGYAVLAFDHRHFGASSGTPRQLLHVGRQLDDWRAAISFARRRPGVDPDRVVIWGTSFGGGHVIRLAREHPAGVVAALAQCPFTDGLASARAMSVRTTARLGVRAARDVLGAVTHRPPTMVATAGRPHSAALMTAPDALSGFLGLVPDGDDGADFENAVAARVALRVPTYRPARRLRDVRVPIWAGLATQDSVAPARASARLLARAHRAEVRHYDVGHFGIYHDPWRSAVVADQLDFLRRHVREDAPA